MADFDATNRAKFYERQLLQKLIAVNRETSMIFSRFISLVSPLLKQYRYNYKNVIVRDPQLEIAVTSEIARFKNEFQQYVELNQTEAWQMAEERTQDIIGKWAQQTATAEIPNRGVYAQNMKALEAFMKRKINGMNLSDRVWNVATNMQDQLHYYLGSGMSVGRSAEVISRDVRQLLNEPDKRFRRVRNPRTGKLEPSKPMQEYHPGRGVCRSSYQNARRLAATEINMAYRSSNMEMYRNTPEILGYEIKLSANHPEPDICDEAAGIYPKEFQWDGWHPRCRCYDVPVMMADVQFEKWANGEPVQVPYANDVPNNFKQYMKAHQEQFERWNTKPYFIRNNEKYINRIYEDKPIIPVQKFVKPMEQTELIAV